MRNLMLRAAGVALLVCGAATSAYATDPVAKWCQGVKIAAFPGGPQGGVFANNVYNGYRQAELDLGPSVTYYFSDWDPNKMLTQLQQAIATKVDGVAFMGHPGDDASDPLIDKAFAQGIIFTTANTALPKAQKKYGPEGMGYVGAPNHAAGYALGAEAAKRAGLKSGDEAFVWGLKGQGGDRGQRTVGVIEALEKAGAKVIYQEIDKATDADPNAGTATFVGVMKANPGIKVVVTDHGALTSNVGVLRSRRVAEARPGAVRRLRHVAEYGEGDQGRLSEPGDRPAALSAGLSADPQHLPDQEVRLLRSRRQHGGRLRRRQERRCRRAAGGEGNPVSSGRRLRRRWAAPRFSRKSRGGGMAEPAASSAGEPPVIELRNVSKSFGEVRSLSGVNFQVNRREIVGLLGDNGVGQVHARQGRDGLPHPGLRRRDLFSWQAHGRLVCRAGAGPRHRDGLSGAGALREAADLAQHVHGARVAHAARPARRRPDARRIRRG